MTTLRWQVRLLDSRGAPAPGVAVDLQVFGLKEGAWNRLDSQQTDEDGIAGSRVEIEDETLVYAPAVRLVEPGGDRLALLSTSPSIGWLDRPTILGADFGDVTRITGSVRDTTVGLGRPLDLDRDVAIGGVATGPGLSRVSPSLTKSKFADFTSALGGEIGAAQQMLKDSGFALATASVKTKVILGAGGTEVTLPPPEGAETGPLTDIEFDFEPTADAAEAGNVPVPDVRQLTESAARRVLGSVGIELEASHGPALPDAALAEGQAMLQSPAAGTTTPRGGRVLVVFVQGEPPISED